MGLDRRLGQVQGGGDLAVGQRLRDLRSAPRARAASAPPDTARDRARPRRPATAGGRTCRAAGGSRSAPRRRRRWRPPGCRTAGRWASASLSRKPLAPARSAAWAYSSRSKVVRISTRLVSPCSTISRVASMPSMPGIRTSISTTSGASRRVSSSASRPSAASPTTDRSSCDSSTIRNPIRSSGWSSASSTVELIADPARPSGAPSPASRRPGPGRRRPSRRTPRRAGASRPGHALPARPGRRCRRRERRRPRCRSRTARARRRRRRARRA